MANICGGSIQACAMRVARLLPSGIPAPGTGNLIVTDALVEVTITPVYADGTDVEKKVASGKIKFSLKDVDRFKRVDLSMNVASVDAELHELLAGGDVLTNGSAVGYAFPKVGVGTGCDDDDQDAVSIELWTRHIVEGGFIDPDQPYLHWVLPRSYWRIDPRTVNEEIMDNQFVGFGIENPNWFDGPENDWPVASDRVVQWLPTDSVPTPECGAQSLSAS